MMRWEDEALCRDGDPELWFPHQGGYGPKSKSTNHQIEVAKAWCAQCPVMQPCLERADELGLQTEGIWGGLTKDERSAMRRARQRRLRAEA